MFTLAPRWRRVAVPTILALTATLGLTAASSGATRPAQAAFTYPQAAVKPTIVLVHGAFTDSSSWAPEIALLRGLGFTVYAPADPLRSLSGDAAYIRSFLQTISGPVVLVGHSYGGAVITEAAQGLTNVKALVYVAAFAPDTGESLATALPAATYPGSHLSPSTLVVRPYPDPAAPGGTNADLYISPASFHDVFANDNLPVIADDLAAAQRPLSNTAYTEPLTGTPGWKTIPSWDLVTLDDHAISPSGQQFMAARAHATTTQVSAAHDVSLSQPDVVDRIILEAAASMG